jgi:hypothetical protein
MSRRLAAVRLVACARIETLAQECRGAREARQFSWRLSNKQSLVICANFERGLFKNAAHPPVDGVNPKSQN